MLRPALRAGVVAAFLTVGPSLAVGQAAGAIAGLVRDRSGSPVAGAAIVLLPSTQVVSGPDGRFGFGEVPSGRRQLTINAPGFRSVTVGVTVGAGATARIDIRLAPSVTVLKELSARAVPVPGSIRTTAAVADGLIYEGTKNEIVQLAGSTVNLAEKTGRQVFAKVPGVFVYDMDGSGNQVNIATRGLDPHRSWEFNVRQDGVLLNSDLYGYPASHYSPPMEAIERIEVTRGTAALQYGSQFGGLLNYVTKADTSDRVRAEAISSAGSNGLLSTYAAAGGHVGKLTYYGYLNERRSGGYRVGSTSNAAAQYLGARLALSPRLRAQASIGHSTYLYRLPGPLTDAQFATDPRMATRSRNYYNPDIVVPSVGLDWTAASGTRLITTVSGVFGPRNSVQFMGFANQPDGPDGAGQYATRQVDIDRFRSVTMESRLTRPWHVGAAEQVLGVGVSVGINRMRRQQGGVGTRASDYDLSITAAGYSRDVTYRTSNAAVYAENLFRLSSRWSVVPGVRVELGRTRMAGRLAYYDPADTPRDVTHRYPLAGIRSVYRLPSGVEVYAGFSQAYRPQILKDLLPASALERTDRHIKDSRGWTLEGGVRGGVGGRIRYDVTAFELRIDNRFGTILDQDATGPFLFRTNVGSSRTRGVEVGAEAYLFQLAGAAVRIHTATSWNDGRYRHGSVTANGTNVDIAGNKVESVPTWISRSGVAIDGQRLTISALASWVSSSFADALNTVTPSVTGAVGLVPGYFLVDLNGGYRISGGVRLRAGISNLFDRRYFTKRPQFYPGPGIWPSDGRSGQVTVELRP